MGRVPTIGRIVHVKVNREIVPAIIVHVWDRSGVNVMVFNKNGATTLKSSLKVVDRFSEENENIEACWPEFSGADTITKAEEAEEAKAEEARAEAKAEAARAEKQPKLPMEEAGTDSAPTAQAAATESAETILN
jgi:hypothetical protein